MTEKTYDVRDVLGPISGLSREAMDEIIVEVKANQAKLASCRRHFFEPMGKRAFADRYRCSRCKGEVDSSARHWYELGLEHSL